MHVDKEGWSQMTSRAWDSFWDKELIRDGLEHFELGNVEMGTSFANLLKLDL